MQCLIHPENPASGSCAHCGQPFCQECLVHINGKFYCKEHAAMLLNQNRPGHGEGYRVEPPAPPYQHPHNAPPYPHGAPPPPHPHHRPPNYPNPNVVINNYAGPGHPPYYQPPYYPPYYNYKNKLVALILCIIFGLGGFHRFYVGKIGTGLIWLFTGGLFGIGWIVDIILIATDSFSDSNGYKLIS